MKGEISRKVRFILVNGKYPPNARDGKVHNFDNGPLSQHKELRQKDKRFITK